MKRMLLPVFALALIATIAPTGRWELITKAPNAQSERKMFDGLRFCEVAKDAFLANHKDANDKLLADFRMAYKDDKNARLPLNNLATAICLPDAQT